jgi:transposase
VDEQGYQQEIARLKRRIEDQEAEIKRLKRLLEEALRTAKRQAAPFSRRNPKAHPRKPGRKAGSQYGRQCRRPIPEQIDEVIDVPLPAQCPHCGSEVQETEVVSQYQSEIPPPRVQRIEFRIHQGCCPGCGRGVEGRHPRQTSAAGIESSQLGPRSVALATELNKGLGLPYGKVARVLEQGWGLRVSRSGLCRAIARVAAKAAPTYQALLQRIRGEPSVTPDETGWKVAARLWWMWVFVSMRMTVYAILPGRGFAEAARILGEDFAGFLVRDGYSAYRRFEQAYHQSCLNHLLDRCRQMIEAVGCRTAEFPRRVQSILRAALRLRDRRDQGRISERGLAVARGQMEARLDRELDRRWCSPANRRLADHLLRERQALFTFLYCRGLDATNYRAEQAIRFMVVARKVWGGNRTEAGAHTQSILLTVMRTSRQQNRLVLPLLEQLICSPQPVAIDLLAPQTISR